MSDTPEVPTLRLRISPAIAVDYLDREVFPDLSESAGVHHVSHEVAREVASDAQRYADAMTCPPETPIRVRNAYRALLDQLAEHERECDCPRKDPRAVALGRKGGSTTAARRTPQERSEASRQASRVRWSGHVKKARPAPADAGIQATEEEEPCATPD